MALPPSELSGKLPSIDESVLGGGGGNNEEANAVREKLTTIVAKVDEMRQQRAQLLNRLKLSIQDDDLTKVIASRQQDVQTDEAGFFREQLKKHQELKVYLEQNLSAQDNILRALAESNAAYAVERRRMQEASRERAQFIENLILSYQSVDELIEKASKVVIMNFYFILGSTRN